MLKGFPLKKVTFKCSKNLIKFLRQVIETWTDAIELRINLIEIFSLKMDCSNLERRTEGILSFEFDVEKPIFVFALFVELSYPFADLSDFAPDLKEETDSFSHV